MEEERYIQTQKEILLLIPLIKALPLVDFLNAISHCETVAPIIDPTLYMKGATKLGIIKRYAEALRRAQEELEE